MSTTFINRSIEEAVLLDLKHLLIEAKQKVPEFLQNLGGEIPMIEGAGKSFNFIRIQNMIYNTL
jgi:ATP-dependent RNA helicase DDX41